MYSYSLDFENLGTEGCSKTQVFERFNRQWQGIEKQRCISGYADIKKGGKPVSSEIITVGTELLLGEITNTNAAYLSQRFAELGINVYRHTSIGDNLNRLRDAIAEAFTRSDIVVTTGGAWAYRRRYHKRSRSRVFWVKNGAA